MASPLYPGVVALLIVTALATPSAAFAAGEAPKFPDTPTQGNPLTSGSHAPSVDGKMLTPLSGRPARPAAVAPATSKPRDFSSSAPADPAVTAAALRGKQALFEAGAPLNALLTPDGKFADVVTILPGDAAADAAAAPRPKSTVRENERAWSVSPALGAIPRAEWAGRLAPKPASFGTTAPGAATHTPFAYPPPDRAPQGPATPRLPEVTTAKPLDPAVARHGKEVRP